MRFDNESEDLLLKSQFRMDFIETWHACKLYTQTTGSQKKHIFWKILWPLLCIGLRATPDPPPQKKVIKAEKFPLKHGKLDTIYM